MWGNMMGTQWVGLWRGFLEALYLSWPGARVPLLPLQPQLAASLLSVLQLVFSSSNCIPPSQSHFLGMWCVQSHRSPHVVWRSAVSILKFSLFEWGASSFILYWSWQMMYLAGLALSLLCPAGMLPACHWLTYSSSLSIHVVPQRNNQN